MCTMYSFYNAWCIAFDEVCDNKNINLKTWIQVITNCLILSIKFCQMKEEKNWDLRYVISSVLSYINRTQNGK